MSPTTGISLDSGALIAVERGQVRTRALLEEALDSDTPVHVVAGVLAQVWRDGARQARLARFVDAEGVHVEPLDGFTSRAVGELCGRSGHDDVVDVHVALHARVHNHRVVTSDPDDLHRVDPRLAVIAI